MIHEPLRRRATEADRHESTDHAIDSQIASLQATGASALLVAAIPKFAAQAIGKGVSAMAV
jgi:branched-chain amino acid transport system substrate-binding protein